MRRALLLSVPLLAAGCGAAPVVSDALPPLWTPACTSAQLPLSTRLPEGPPTPEVGPLEDPDEAEVEVYSAVITAVSCARKMVETEDRGALTHCSPMEAARTGYAIFDPAEEAIYLLDESAFHRHQLEAGFRGSMDASGELQGTVDGLGVLRAEEFSITPPPKPGAFKGCL